MNNSPVKSELYVALEMVELTQFLPFTKLNNNPTNRLYVQSYKNKTFQQTRCHIC